MLKGTQTVLGLVIGGVSPLGMAIMGYFVLFVGFEWVYLAIWFLAWVISISLIVFAAKKEMRYAVYCELLSGGFGWVWIASIVAGIWFAISALFMDGSWWEFGYSLLVGGICKGWTRSFMQAQREDMAVGTGLDSVETKSVSDSGNQDIENVVNKFSKVMEELDYVSKFHDIEKLPYPKEEILNSIISAYKLTADENMRETLKVGLLALSHFQEDIGNSPIQGTVDLTKLNIDDLSPEDYLKMNAGIDREKYENLSQQADKEYEGYLELL